MSAQSADNRRQVRGVRVTVAAIVVFMAVVVGGFVYKIQQPRIMTPIEMKINGLYLLDTPRNFGELALTDHNGRPFTRKNLEGRWTLVFFGFTYCPDICPTTMSFLNQLMGQLQGTEAEDTQVVMVTVDPARDTVDQLAGYVPFSIPDFWG